MLSVVDCRSHRAAIIVPEGIIFQSQTAYRELRKMLVKNSLVAVVSLPAGCFNPYSGVKTSILILDKSLARQSETIGFFKVENDGFGLGAQRRAFDKNDLPQVQAELAAYLEALRSQQPTAVLRPTCGLVVPKEKIAANGDYNLSGERYREGDVRLSAFPLRRFEEVYTLEYGASLPKEKRVDGPYPVVGSNGITGYHNEYLVDGPAIVVGRKGSAGEVTLIEKNCFPIDTTYYVKQTNPAESNIIFLYWLLKTLNLPELRGGAGVPGLNRTDVYETHQIPLPPMEVQKEIVAEIEGYQKVINGARAVLDHYRPHIPIHPDWPMVEIGEVCRFIDYRGKTPEKTTSGLPLITAKNVREGYINHEPREFIAEADYEAWMTRGIPQIGDVLFTMEAPLGNVAEITMTGRFALAQRLVALCPNRAIMMGAFLKDLLLTRTLQDKIIAHQSGTTVYGIKASVLKVLTIPVPPLATQQAIVAEIESEQALVAANRELITRFEKKIQATLARVWGETAPAPAPDREAFGTASPAAERPAPEMSELLPH